MTADRHPPGPIALLYLGTARVSLGLACGLAAWWPQAVAGFFYHSWMVALVHLVTLGWITFSILGGIYILGPAALGTPLSSRRGDYVAFALALVGVIGMVSHFWIQEFGGMAWSAATVTCGILYVLGRLARGIRTSRLPASVTLPLLFGCATFALAAGMGILLGFDKVYPFLPGYVLANVFAHAHLAALGWATMMIMGGYRLLGPQPRPATFGARSMVASAILVEIGALGLFVSLVLQSQWALLFAGSAIAGLAMFAAEVRGRLRADFGGLHAAGAVAAVIAAATIGVALLVAPASARSLRAAAAYGILGLVGFLAQMVIAMEAPIPGRERVLQGVVFAGWTVSVPVLAGGLFLESPVLVGAGAWALAAAVAVGAIDDLFVLVQLRAGRD